MAAADPLGGQKYWVDGQPFIGVRNSIAETGGLKFWADGLPVAFLLPPGFVLVYMQPDADNSDGNWTNELDSTTDLYASIDETSFSDADYIKSGADPTGDICKIHLADPGVSVAEPFIVRYRYWKSGSETAELKVRLMQGSTEIAEWTHSGVTTTHTTAEQTLSGPEFASITDFTDLYLEFEATTV